MAKYRRKREYKTGDNCGIILQRRLWRWHRFYNKTYEKIMKIIPQNPCKIGVIII